MTDFERYIKKCDLSLQDDVYIYERVKQVRKKHIKVFGVPYESYVY